MSRDAEFPEVRKPATKDISEHTAFLGHKLDLSPSKYMGKSHEHAVRCENDEMQQEHWPLGLGKGEKGRGAWRHRAENKHYGR